MIKNIGIFLAFSLLISCGEKKIKDQSKKTKTDSNKSSEKICTELFFDAKSIKGEYIVKQYIENIEKTKSIYNSRKFDNHSLFGFILDFTNLITKNPVLYGFKVHEGGYDKPLIYDTLKKKFKYDLSKSNENKQDYFEITKRQNSLEFYFPFKKKNEYYRKVNIDIQTELRKVIIEGNYCDTLKSKNIIFNKNGEVENFKDYVYYELIYDFTEGIQFDAIIFFKTKKGGNWSNGDLYKYEINKNTIKLNYVQTNWETLEHIIETDTILLENKNCQ